jgi:hypothetical protein
MTVIVERYFPSDNPSWKPIPNNVDYTEIVDLSAPGRWVDVSNLYKSPEGGLLVFDTVEEAREWINGMSPWGKPYFRIQGEAWEAPPPFSVTHHKSSKPMVVTQLQYAAVKETYNTISIDGIMLDRKYWDFSYDCWKWNTTNNKWIRLSSACGFGKKEHADHHAHKINDEVIASLSNNTPTVII